MNHHHGMNAGMRAARQGMKRMEAQNRAFARGFFRRLQRRNSQKAAAALRQSNWQSRVDRLRTSLDAAMSEPLSCTQHVYPSGAGALFFETNWTAPDGTAAVAFEASTVLPGTTRRVAAYVWSESGIEAIDFADESLDDATSRGRVFIFPANFNIETGQPYSIHSATFQAAKGSPLGLWTFASAGRYRGQTFLLGRGGMGTFVAQQHRSLLVVRPWNYDARRRAWLWSGRSSVNVEGKLQFVIDSPMDPGPHATISYLVPPGRAGSDVLGLVCKARDERGDPIGVVDTRVRVTHGVKRIGNTPYFFAFPNQRDDAGRPLFAVRTSMNASGEAVLEMPFEEDGAAITVEIPANFTDAKGIEWLVRYPNAKDKRSSAPIVLVALKPV